MDLISTLRYAAKAKKAAAEANPSEEQGPHAEVERSPDTSVAEGESDEPGAADLREEKRPSGRATAIAGT
jgi:hypothetical protein